MKPWDLARLASRPRKFTHQVNQECSMEKDTVRSTKKEILNRRRASVMSDQFRHVIEGPFFALFWMNQQANNSNKCARGRVRGWRCCMRNHDCVTRRKFKKSRSLYFGRSSKVYSMFGMPDINICRDGWAMPSFQVPTLGNQTDACSVGNQRAGGAEGVAYPRWVSKQT